MLVYYNANPINKRVGDCTVRAISKALNQSWGDTYIELCLQGLLLCDMPSANYVWGDYLEEKGYVKNLAPNGCTVEDFCNEHTKGKYLLATGSHVVAAEDGNYYDTWDSGNEVIIYYFEKEF